MHQLVPVGVAQLGHVEPERVEQILRMARRQRPLGQHGAQPHALRIVVVAAEQAAFQAVEQRELAVGRELGMVGDVVGDAHELVERQDRRTEARMDEMGRHREILVPVSLARSQLARRRHFGSHFGLNLTVDSLAVVNRSADLVLD